MAVDPGPRIRESTGRSRNSGNQASIKPDLPEATPSGPSPRLPCPAFRKLKRSKKFGFACKVLQI